MDTRRDSAQRGRLRWLALGLCLGLLAPGGGQAQTDTLRRGVIRTNQPVAPPKDPGRYLYFIVGINEYEHWFDLENAVEDARGFERILAEDFGFQAAYPTLLDREATRNNILKAMDRLYHNLRPTDNLIVFFAGHGHTRIDTVGENVVETGFLIPRNGRPVENDEWLTYIDLGHFLDRTALLPARHITVILDACHSGFALGDNATSFRGISSLGPEITGNVSRRVISSARHDQLAQDSGPVPRHSLFTGVLLEALTSGQCDLNDDLYITTSEIGLYLEQEVNRFSGGLQTPDFGAFRLDQRGEMVLALDADAPEMLIRRADAQLLRGDIDRFFDTFAQIEARDLSLAEYHRLKYRAELLRRDGDAALRTLERMLRDHRADVSPRITFELSRLMPSAQYWRNALSLPSSPESRLGVAARQNGQEVPVEQTRSGIHRIGFQRGTPYTLELSNRSDAGWYLYGLYVDGYDVEVLKLPGLPGGHLLPGATWTSPAYENDFGITYEQFHLLLSPLPVEAFAQPPDRLLTQLLPPWEAPPGSSSEVLFITFQ